MTTNILGKPVPLGKRATFVRDHSAQPQTKTKGKEVGGLCSNSSEDHDAIERMYRLTSQLGETLDHM